ncbi:hypothetical protein JMJ77_0010841 [Colletotrichum scovillei]|uniref:Uncharacterized protein n=1 Tax=Colletotrichum scovillei TaxID=1209932 RepID=A0A9P7R125_9PEZI|nr:hypothetical protein JMJ77_0010841 [Colletotrichum scovillei]KAG7059806.1 hypothetical protein JMJ78_0015094 [Colletotrichum scovillei]KAG7067255.1 hypothetical protein JMJ76_0008697 [Colletotrichum scovillei]
MNIVLWVQTEKERSFLTTHLPYL